VALTELQAPLDLLEIAAGLATFQRSDGLFLQTRDGVGDPWNHVEVLMALTVAGQYDLVEKGYRWLRDNQLGDGSWFHYYRADSVHSARIDFNVVGYVATGLLHYWQCTNDVEFVREMWPTVIRAIELIKGHLRRDGAIAWSLDSRGRQEPFSLLTGSSSLAHSLHNANKLSVILGGELLVPTSQLSALQHRVSLHPNLFANKQQFAMDWYYPVLTGAREYDELNRNVFEESFLIDGFGVRCVSSADWVTTAETAEYAMTLLRNGDREMSRKLLIDINQLRSPNGLFFTGAGHPSRATYPLHEVSSYSAAAVVLAWDALERLTPGHTIFTAGVEVLPPEDCRYC
jgi:hypothetical protein